MKTAIGIDHGDVRIGVAGADSLGMMAHPLETLDARKPDVIQKIGAIMKTRGAELIVIGLPRNMDGTFGPAAEKTRAFATKLRNELGCEVVEWDERMTTLAAQRALHESGRDAKKSRSVIDQAAAQIILQNWLDAQAIKDGLM
jgi:putative Holliday junction resolvase